MKRSSRFLGAFTQAHAIAITLFWGVLTSAQGADKLTELRPPAAWAKSLLVTVSVAGGNNVAGIDIESTDQLCAQRGITSEAMATLFKAELDRQQVPIPKHAHANVMGAVTCLGTSDVEVYLVSLNVNLIAPVPAANTFAMLTIFNGLSATTEDRALTPRQRDEVIRQNIGSAVAQLNPIMKARMQESPFQPCIRGTLDVCSGLK